MYFRARVLGTVTPGGRNRLTPSLETVVCRTENGGVQRLVGTVQTQHGCAPAEALHAAPLPYSRDGLNIRGRRQLHAGHPVWEER